MDRVEPGIRIETREDLLYLLAEAAEIEHNLMCCYLYAAFSLRRGVDGLGPAEARAVADWRRAILAVAIDEMTHLALVANLTAALGGSPHLGRPNFPVSGGLYPSGVVCELAGFSRDTLDHFIYLERPEGSDIADSLSFAAPRRYVRERPAGRLMPSAQDYPTVGHLYRAIRHGLDTLSAKLGEAALFCAGPAAQLDSVEAPLQGLGTVADLAGAHRAIDTIVHQGEGSPGHSEESHYERFLAIRAEFEALSAANPSFAPAHPVARNPVMRRPPNPEGRVFITDPEAALVLDLANALYGHMLRCLAGIFGRPAEERAEKRLLIGAAIELMRVMSPVASYLASLPAGPAYPGINAGMTFAMLRDVGRLPAGASEQRVLGERLQAMADYVATLFPAPHALATTAEQLAGLAQRFVPATGEPPRTQPSAPPAASAAAASPAPEETPPEVAEGHDIVLSFDTMRCIHGRACVLGAPEVFLSDVVGPWLFPDKMPADALARIAQSCPSGAVTYRRKDGGADEAPPPVNTLHLRENGPYALRAELRLDGVPLGFRATLCRCGASKRKPFCDASHSAIGFDASGEPATRPSAKLAQRNGPLEIRPQRNGPLLVIGNLEICAGTGRTIERVTETRLCRCGGSQSKPFCDGTHLRNGFMAP